jgi:Ca2+-binding RTX toxin-like protein
MVNAEGPLPQESHQGRPRHRNLVPALLILASLLLLGSPAEATVTSSVTGGVLTVTSDDHGDQIKVRCSESGSVLVNRTGPDSGSVNCSAITSIVVNAGGGADVILLQKVTEVAFSALQLVSVDSGDGGDEVRASGVLDSISAGAGDDFVQASLIHGDTVAGGDGIDRLRTDVDSDVIVSDDALTFPADAILLDSLESVWIDGTDGSQTIDAQLYTGSLIVSSGGGDDRVIGGSGTNDLRSGDGNDEVIGGPGKDRLSTGDGDDTIAGGAGGNTLKAGAGSDVINGGPDNDEILTGEGADVARGHGGGDAFLNVQGRDRLIGGAGNDLFSVFIPETVRSATSFLGGAGKDSLRATHLMRRTVLTDSSIEFVLGGGQIKSVELAFLYASDESQSYPYLIDAQGFSGDVVIGGGPEDDIIIGGSGNDDLFGWLGDDTILGGSGYDHLGGSEGSDRCDGGPGGDRLVHCETRQN